MVRRILGKINLMVTVVWRILGKIGLNRLESNLCVRAALQSGKPVKLHVGCGGDKRKGWINIDADYRFKPDIIAYAQDFSMFSDDSVDEIACFHLFEHLSYSDALDALKEWHRVLKEGGKLSLELPNLKRCAEILYKGDKEAQYYAMMGVFGQVPGDLKKVSFFQVHKYGWMPETLSNELKKVGFSNINQVPVTQTSRPATRYDRDMRLECEKVKKCNMVH